MTGNDEMKLKPQTKQGCTRWRPRESEREKEKERVNKKRPDVLEVHPRRSGLEGAAGLRSIMTGSLDPASGNSTAAVGDVPISRVPSGFTDWSI